MEHVNKVRGGEKVRHRKYVQRAHKHLLIECNIHGHRTLKAPHPVWSAQLIKVPPNQYHSGGPCGNPGCCGFFLFFKVHISLALNNILGHGRDVQSLALNKILDHGKGLALNNIHGRDMQSLALNKILGHGKGLALNNILGHGRDMQSLALNKLLEAKRCEMSGPK